MSFPIVADAIRRVREDVARGDFQAAIIAVTQVLVDSSVAVSSGQHPESVVNQTQRLRLHLLRADCYSAVRSHQRALDDAKLAIEISSALSPQAFFVAGREYSRLGRLKEAVEHFETAETLLTTGIGVSETAPCNDARGADEDAYGDAWAILGVNPRDAPAGTPPLLPNSTPTQPIVPSYEWVQDLEQWRRCYAETKLLQQMTQTHVVPARVGSQAIDFVAKQTAAASNRTQIVVIRNHTTSVLRFAFQHFEGCELYDCHAFADQVKPSELAVAVVVGTGWSGSAASVAYTVEMIATAGFMFESPLMSEYVAGCWLRAGRSSADSQRSTDTAGVKLKSRPTATGDIVVSNGKRYKAMVTQVGRVVSFTVAEVRPVTLTIPEILPALEFLPAAALRKVSAASWHLRDCVSRLAPQHFFTPPAPGGSADGCGWFPNYLFPADFQCNPWIVRDPREVVWRLVFDGLSSELEDYALTDATESRVLTYGLDLQGKGINATIYYGGGKRKQLVSKISDSWYPFSRTITWKLNNGRKLGSLLVNSVEVALVPEGSDAPILVMRKGKLDGGGKSVPLPVTQGKASSTSMHNSLIILSMPGDVLCAEVRYIRKVPLSATKRGHVVADVVLRTGADAFLVGALASIGRTKWAV